MNRVVESPQQSEILIVDDEPAMREMLQMILGMDGYKIATAANGKEALDVLNFMNPPSLILLDLMMPIMSGWQFFIALKADPRFEKIPVVVMTAYSNSEIKLPPVEVLEKPFDITLLRKTVSEYCRKGAQDSK